MYGRSVAGTRRVVVVAAVALVGAALAGTARASEYCDGCQPPMRYSGGPLLDTHGPKGLTVTPIYWGQFPSNYEALIDGYIANVAAASGANTNVYSIDTEYYDIFGGGPSYAQYHVTAGTPIVDTRPLPRHGCGAGSGYDTCVTDAQLQAEPKRVLAVHHQPTGLAYFYPVFFPPHVETADRTGDNSASGYC